MTKYERYKNVPHFDLIEENKPIVISSIFTFNSNDELYPFLAACKDYNCKVFFENEKLIIYPKDDLNQTLELFCYTVVMNCRKIGDDYVRYLGNLAQTKHESDLKKDKSKRYKKYLYKLTFPNKKVYFGTSSDVQTRWADNGTHYKHQEVYKYIRQFGWDNITKEVLYEGDGTSECNELVLKMERNLIEEWGESCYNYNSNPIRHPTKGKGLKWTIDGVTKTAVEWCKEYNRGYGRVMSRMNKHKLTPKQALTYPSVPGNMCHDAKGYWQSLGLEV